MLTEETKRDVIRMQEEAGGEAQYVHLPRWSAKEMLQELKRLMVVEEVITKAASDVCFALETADMEPGMAKKEIEKLLLRMREVKG